MSCTTRQIQEVVAARFCVTVHAIRGTGKTRTVSLARMVGMYLARELTGASYPEVGLRFGRKHHTTAMYAHARVPVLMAANSDLERAVQAILATLRPEEAAPDDTKSTPPQEATA